LVRLPRSGFIAQRIRDFGPVAQSALVGIQWGFPLAMPWRSCFGRDRSAPRLLVFAAGTLLLAKWAWAPFPIGCQRGHRPVFLANLPAFEGKLQLPARIEGWKKGGFNNLGKHHPWFWWIGSPTHLFSPFFSRPYRSMAYLHAARYGIYRRGMPTNDFFYSDRRPTEGGLSDYQP